MSRRALAVLCLGVGSLIGQAAPAVAVRMLLHRRSVFG